MTGGTEDSDGAWNTQSDQFAFALPSAWRDLIGDEVAWLAHEEGCAVLAAAAAGVDEHTALVHVTVVPGDLNGYVEWLVAETWGQSGHVTRVKGPFLTGVGGLDGALLEYACLDYQTDDHTTAEAPPRDMSLLLVIVEVAGYLYRISLYAPKTELSERGPEFQAILDSWQWAALA